MMKFKGSKLFFHAIEMLLNTGNKMSTRNRFFKKIITLALAAIVFRINSNYRPVPSEQRRQRHQGRRGPDQDHDEPHLEHRHPEHGHVLTRGHLDMKTRVECGDARDARDAGDAGPVWLGVHDAEDDPGALQSDTADQPDGHHARHQ